MMYHHPNFVINEIAEVRYSEANFWFQIGCTEKELCKVPLNSITIKECTRIFCSARVVNYQAPYICSFGKQAYVNLENGTNLQCQTYFLDRTLPKDSSSMAGLEEKIIFFEKIMFKRTRINKKPILNLYFHDTHVGFLRSLDLKLENRRTWKHIVMEFHTSQSL